MTQPVSMKDMIKQLAEGQRHLQLVIERQATALKSQADLVVNNQQVQDTAILRLADVIANARMHPNVPSSVLQK